MTENVFVVGAPVGVCVCVCFSLLFALGSGPNSVVLFAAELCNTS